MSVVLVVILSMFAGVFLVLAVLAMVKFYQQTSRLQQTGSSMVSQFEALGQTMERQARELSDVSAALERNQQSAEKQHAQTLNLAHIAIQRLVQVTSGLENFNKLMLALPENQRGVAGSGPVGDSAVYAYSEAQAAEQETARELRRQGFETDPRESRQPSIARVEVVERPSVGQVTREAAASILAAVAAVAPPSDVEANPVPTTPA